MARELYTVDSKGDLYTISLTSPHERTGLYNLDLIGTVDGVEFDGEHVYVLTENIETVDGNRRFVEYFYRIDIRQSFAVTLVNRRVVLPAPSTTYHAHELAYDGTDFFTVTTNFNRRFSGFNIFESGRVELDKIDKTTGNISRVGTLRRGSWRDIFGVGISGELSLGTWGLFTIGEDLYWGQSRNVPNSNSFAFRDRVINRINKSNAAIISTTVVQIGNVRSATHVDGTYYLLGRSVAEDKVWALDDLSAPAREVASYAPRLDFGGATSAPVDFRDTTITRLSRFNVTWNPSGLAIPTRSRLARFNIQWEAPGTTKIRLARFSIPWSAPTIAPRPQPITTRLARFDITWQPLPAPTVKRLARFNIAWQPIPIPTTARLARFPITWFPVNISLPNPNQYHLARFNIGWEPLIGTPTDPIVPALHKIEFRPYGETLWRDATPRLASAGKISQGREFSTLGGGNPKSSPMKFAGNFIGPAPKPGDECRVFLDDVVKFQGALADVHEISRNMFSTTWLGPMWGITSDQRDASPRLYIQQTPGEILESVGRIHRTPTLAPISNVRYTREIPWGAGALDTLEELSGGVIYDTPQIVYLEFPQERKALPAIRKLTDIQLKAADEFEIPIPRKHENAFGVINHVQVIARVRQPRADATRVKDIRIPRQLISIPRNSNTSVEFDVQDPSLFVHPDTPLIYSWDIDFDIADVTGTRHTILNLVGSFGPSVNTGSSAIATVTTASPGGNVFSLTLSVNKFRVVARGNALTVSFDYSAIVEPLRRLFYDLDIEVSGTIKIVSAIPLEQNVTDFSRDVIIESSVDRYKLRSRGIPIILTILSRDNTHPPTLSNEADDILARLGRRYLDRHKEPIPVYEVVTNDERIILSRGMSHREHLRLQDGTDGDFFVERIETQLSPLLQTAWLVDEAHAIGVAQSQ